MLKTKFKFSLALLATAATALSGCGKKQEETEVEVPGPVSFWSCFGGAYTNVLDTVVSDISSSLELEINHTSKGDYDETKRAMDAAIALGPDYYPDIAQGYPDHFATYLSSDVLKPLDSYFTDAEIADYYSEYMNENKFYDNNGKKAKEHIYGIPFNKSTELLGYNGVFVDYCATKDPSLANIPASWDDWAVQGPKYNTIFKDLMKQEYTQDNKKLYHPGAMVFGKQNAEGKASEFEVFKWDDTQPETTTNDAQEVVLTSDTSKVLLLDFRNVDPNESILMSWDATDNAFITLVRQWKAQYTELPSSENKKIAKKRVGNVLFNSSENQSKVIDCLEFFHGLNKQKIFGIPKNLGGSYSSEAFALCKCMFMICSSGGLSYNTANWRHRFRVAPIPYKYADMKTVISQGANICMTNKKNYTNASKVIKAITTSEFQAQWCLETGYYPCSKSAVNTDAYQNFLKETTYFPDASATRIAYREGSKLNSDHYMSETEGWVKFVDPAFKGSSVLRQTVKGVLESVFSIGTAGVRDSIKTTLNSIETVPAITGETTIKFVH